MTGRKFFSDLLKFADNNTSAQRIIQAYERGLLTIREAEQQIIDLYKNHLVGADKKIKEWYISSYPDDEVGQEIDDTLTFEELYHAMKMNDDFYETIGEGIDSVVRERIFTEMSYIFKVSYNDIYNLWLKAE